MKLREAQEYPKEIDLREYVALFWGEKWIIFFIVNLSIIGALVHAFFIADEVYQAQTSTMPLNSATGGNLSALRSLVPSGLLSNIPININKGQEGINRFINLLQSRMMAEEIVDSLDLANQLYPKIPPDKQPELQESIALVQKLSNATDNRKGLLLLTAKAPFPQLAADLANAYIQHLQHQLPNWFVNPDLSWETSPRMSMAEAIAAADREKAFILDQQTQAKALAKDILTQIESAQRTERDQDFRPFLNRILTSTGYQTATEILTRRLEQTKNPQQCIRLQRVVAYLTEKMGA